MKVKIGEVEMDVDDKVAAVLHSQEIRAAALEETATQFAPVMAAIEATTGHKDVGQALAALAGIKEKADQADVLAKENGELKAELDKVAEAKKSAEIVALLDAASTDGRLTPANRAKLTGAEAPSFMKEPANVKAYLDMLPKVAQSEGSREVKTDDTVVALTDEEKRIAANQKIDEAHVAAFKAGGPEALRKLLEAEKAAKAAKK